MLRSLAVVCAILSAGCVDSDSIIVVRPDGSGTVTNTVFIKPGAIDVLRSLKGSSSDPSDVFNDEEMREVGVRMGEGVKLESVKRLKKEGWEGARVSYTFTDISNLTLVTGAQVVWESTEGATTLISFRFAPAAGTTPAKLTILRPITEPSEDRAQSKDRSPRTDTEADKATMQLFRSALEGMRLSILVDVAGRIVKTNADAVKGSRVPLEKVDFDQVLANGGDIEWFLAVEDGTMSLADARRKMEGTKGFWIQLKPEVTVEFTKK